jgi:hypothetical protein
MQVRNMIKTIEKNVEFEVVPGQRIRDRLLHFILRGTRGDPKRPVFTQSTMDLVMDMLLETAKKENLGNVSLIPRNTMIRGISGKNVFEKLFGAKLHYHESEVMEYGETRDRFGYYEMADLPSRKYDGIESVRLAEVYQLQRNLLRSLENRQDVILIQTFP